MVLPDVNVLVHAHREDSADHAAYRQWLERTVNGDEAYGVSDLVLSGLSAGILFVIGSYFFSKIEI